MAGLRRKKSSCGARSRIHSKLKKATSMDEISAAIHWYIPLTSTGGYVSHSWWANIDIRLNSSDKTRWQFSLKNQILSLSGYPITAQAKIFTLYFWKVPSSLQIHSSLTSLIMLRWLFFAVLSKKNVWEISRRHDRHLCVHSSLFSCHPFPWAKQK